MPNLSILGYGEIRQTEDERFSIYDVIEVVGGQKDQYNTWKRLTEGYPEVLLKCQDFKFPGQGQRPTPVANKENILYIYIIGLLPGAVGRSYREEAAKLMIEKLNGTSLTGELAVVDSGLASAHLIEMQSQMQQMLLQNQQMMAQGQQMMAAIAGLCQHQGIQIQSLSFQLTSVTSRLNQIEAIQQEAIASLDEVPAPVVEAEELTTRAKINRLVRDFGTATSIHYQEVWRRVYREFKDRYHIDLRTRAKNTQADGGKVKALDVCEQVGMLEELYAVAFELLKS